MLNVDVLNRSLILISMKEMVCRLCLQTIVTNNYCQPVEESLLKSLKLNINISKENVMCIECANSLRAFSNFTRAYMEDDEKLLHHNGVKLELEAIETTINSKPLVKTEIRCSFCTKAHGREDLMPVEESKGNKIMANMLEQYISETKLKNTEELLGCKTCLESLEGVLGVTLKCLEVEENISKYVELEGTDDEGHVELKRVQEFMFGPDVKSEIGSFGVNELVDGSDQVQEKYTTMAKTEIKYEKEIGNKELIIKTEGDIKSEQSDCGIPDIKSEQNDSNGFQVLIIVNRIIVNRSPSKIKTFQCKSCSFQTKWRSALTKHLLTHKDPPDMFKCEFCSYEGKQKIYLKKHLLTHKNPSEIKMFKCEMCSYVAKQKRHLNRHLLTHKSSSEIKMFKCEMCSYEAKQKGNVKTHSLAHKSPSEIKMFKCESCSYEAKRKNDLVQHLLTHKNPSKVNAFKCEMCSYEAKRKSHLKKTFIDPQQSFRNKDV